MALTTCRCGSSWTGLRIEHCTVCHQSFSGTTSGDKHRIGDPGVPGERRCRTPEEMKEMGMDTNKRGVWTNGGTSPWAKEEV